MGGQNFTERTAAFIQSHQLLKDKDKILVAISGGIDSTVLAYVLHQLGYDIALAHVNYKLRGSDSDEDAKFVNAFGDQLGVDVYLETFDTPKIKGGNKGSVQSLARDIRYRWFDELLKTHAFDRVALGHNADDQVETMLWHFIKGSSVTALGGMPVKRDHFVRPLLWAKRAEIADFANWEELEWRDDASNDSLDYNRNIIRHKIIPLIGDMVKGYHQSLAKTRQHLLEAGSLLELALNELQFRVVKSDHTGTLNIDLNELKPFPAPISALHKFIGKFGFHEDQLKQMLDASPGSKFQTETHEAWVSGHSRIKVYERENASYRDQIISVDMIPGQIKTDWGVFDLRYTDSVNISTDRNLGQLDAGKLSFPLLLRSPKQGDVFCPLGMNNQHQKLQDLFVNLKLSPKEKASQAVLVNDNSAIIWVVGRRLDNRFRLTEQTEKILEISWEKN